MRTPIKFMPLAAAAICFAACLYSCSPQMTADENGNTESDPPAEEERVAITSATANDVGKLLADDMYIYNSSSAAQGAGGKICGVVVYVGNDTGDATYRHGLALSLRNFNGSYCWKNTLGIKDNPSQYNLIADALEAKESGYDLTHFSDRSTNAYLWPAFFYAYCNTVGSDENTTIIAPKNTSGWFLPSIFQWNQIAKGLNDSDARLTLYDNTSLSMFYANPKLEALGAQPFLDGAYWSSSEHSDQNAWLYWANYGKASDKNKSFNYYLRSVLAF